MKRSRILTSLAAFLDETRADELRMVIAYVDTGGHVLCLWREPGAWLGSNDIAVNKAWTATAFSGPTEDEALPTDKLAQMAQPGGDLYGVQNTNQGKVVIFPGGLPVYEDGKLVGGIGVSGSTVENDLKYAQVALEAYLKLAEQENGFVDMPIADQEDSEADIEGEIPPPDDEDDDAPDDDEDGDDEDEEQQEDTPEAELEPASVKIARAIKPT